MTEPCVWILVGFGWLICAALTFWLLIDSWRRTFDVNRSDFRVYILLSLLLAPAALLAGLFLWFGERPQSEWSKQVIWKRKR